MLIAVELSRRVGTFCHLIERLKSWRFSFLRWGPLRHSDEWKEERGCPRGIEAGRRYEKRLIARTWLQGMHSRCGGFSRVARLRSSIFGIKWELQAFRFGLLFSLRETSSFREHNEQCFVEWCCCCPFFPSFLLPFPLSSDPTRDVTFAFLVTRGFARAYTAISAGSKHFR